MSIRIARTIARLWKASAELRSAVGELDRASGTTDFPQRSGRVDEVRGLIEKAHTGANDASENIVAALRLIDWDRMLADPEEGGNDEDGSG